MLDELAQRVHEAHLLGSPAVGLEEARAGDHDRDRHAQQVLEPLGERPRIGLSSSSAPTTRSTDFSSPTCSSDPPDSASHTNAVRGLGA